MDKKLLFIILILSLLSIYGCNRQNIGENSTFIIYCNAISPNSITKTDTSLPIVNTMISCAMVQAEPEKYNQSFYDYNTCMIFENINISIGKCNNKWR